MEDEGVWGGQWATAHRLEAHELQLKDKALTPVNPAVLRTPSGTAHTSPQRLDRKPAAARS